MKVSLLRNVFCVIFFVASVFVFADSAMLVSATGKVEVNRNNSWVTISNNDMIKEGEIISTGFKSEAIIKYKDSVMKMGPLTRITLEKLATSDTKDDVSVFLNTGAVRSTVNHSENKRVSYTVRNPIAVASVRGTDFEFLGNANVNCFSGGVVVIPASMVDPRKDLGIAKPADSEEEESEDVSSDEVLGSAESESVAKSDAPVTETLPPAAGESTTTTPSTDINPNIQKGGVVIVSGQSTNFNDSPGSRPASAKTQFSETINRVSEGVAAASDNESVSTGSSASNTTVIKEFPTSNSTGRIVVSVVWE